MIRWFLYSIFGVYIHFDLNLTTITTTLFLLILWIRAFQTLRYTRIQSARKICYLNLRLRISIRYLFHFTVCLTLCFNVFAIYGYKRLRHVIHNQNSVGVFFGELLGSLPNAQNINRFKYYKHTQIYNFFFKNNRLKLRLRKKRRKTIIAVCVFERHLLKKLLIGMHINHWID